MNFVYLIQSKKNQLLYVGRTNDLNKRLSEHNKGFNPSTRRHIPYEIIYFEFYKDPKDAIVREQKLKHHGSSIGHLKKRLSNSLIK